MESSTTNLFRNFSISSWKKVALTRRFLSTANAGSNLFVKNGLAIYICSKRFLSPAFIESRRRFKERRRKTGVKRSHKSSSISNKTFLVSFAAIITSKDGKHKQKYFQKNFSWRVSPSRVKFLKLCYVTWASWNVYTSNMVT